MSNARDLKRRLGGVLERAMTLATGRNASPDLGSALLVEAERASIEGPAGTVIPNVFVAAVGAPPPPPERSAVERRLADLITEAAVHRGHRFEGPVGVTLAPGGRKPEIETAFETGDLPAWSILTAADGGSQSSVHHNRALIGRSKDGDVVVNANGVSRRHALLWREMGRVWIADLQSANGTYVNGEPVFDVVEVRRSDLILFGDTGFVFGMA